MPAPLRFGLRRWLLVPLGSWVAALTGRRLLVAVGDSHIEPLRDLHDTGALPKTRVRVESVGGATASGIANPNSRTQARPRFERALTLTTRRYSVLACLGEVDAGFLVFAGGDPKQRCDAALAKYFTFLDEWVLQRGRTLLVVTVVPPLVEDYATWKGLQGQRRKVDASWQQRSDITRYWNGELERWCAQHDVPLLDLWSRVTDPATGRVLSEYVNDDPRDHHLHRRRHAEQLAALLRENGFR
ncbi:hypothetical protein [Jatrophihabitans fulvus]